MLNTADGSYRCFVTSIELTPLIQFFFARDDQLLDRIFGIVPVDQAKIVVVCPKRVLFGDGL